MINWWWFWFWNYLAQLGRSNAHYVHKRYQQCNDKYPSPVYHYCQLPAVTLIHCQSSLVLYSVYGYSYPNSHCCASTSLQSDYHQLRCSRLSLNRRVLSWRSCFVIQNARVLKVFKYDLLKISVLKRQGVQLEMSGIIIWNKSVWRTSRID